MNQLGMMHWTIHNGKEGVCTLEKIFMCTDGTTNRYISSSCLLNRSRQIFYFFFNKSLCLIWAHSLVIYFIFNLFYRQEPGQTTFVQALDMLEAILWGILQKIYTHIYQYLYQYVYKIYKAIQSN